MIKDLWINLPVKDIVKSTEFFTKLGFSFNEEYGGTNDSACLVIGEKKMVILLFTEATFKNFAVNEVADVKLGTEVLFSFDAESREEVDEMAIKVTAAGGTIYTQPNEDKGWIYGCGFVDLDGHRWSVLFMDWNKMPKK